MITFFLSIYILIFSTTGLVIAHYAKRYAIWHIFIISIVLYIIPTYEQSLLILQLPSLLDAIESIVFWDLIPWFLFCFLPMFVAYYSGKRWNQYQSQKIDRLKRKQKKENI